MGDTGDPVSPVAAPWPRFTAAQPVPSRTPGVRDPWPRWGWFPREQRAWTFAPGPRLTAAEPGIAPPSPEPAPAVETPDAGLDADADAMSTPSRFVQGLVPTRRSAVMALVPARGREIVLADVAKAARRAAPVAAIAGVVAVAALAFMRRR